MDGTAQAGSDYDATAGTATIPAGESRVDIHVPVHGDLLGEANEGLFLVLDQVSPAVRLGVASEEGVILDDEPVLIAWPTDVYEGQSGTASLAFTVTLSDGDHSTAVARALAPEITQRADDAEAQGTLPIDPVERLRGTGQGTSVAARKGIPLRAYESD